ncbi:MAG: GntR family transcriptional regulator [Clostridiales Family XIII bacterium]|jgi:GntR family transcriptional regulator|nr:GntR family transcriptional regulator [Clostridiales Family XIII bacterium]
MANIPAYRAVYASIKEKIRNGEYPIGSLLPSESELEERYSVSKTTIRKAIDILKSEGYLNVRQGRGSEVMDALTTQKLNSVSSVTETLTQKGYVISTKGMHIKKIPAPHHVSEALKLPDGAQVYRVQRVQCADGIPIAIMENYFIESLFPHLEIYENTFTALYRFLEQQYGLAIKDAWEYLSAVNADFYQAQVLNIPVGTALLRSKRIANNERGPFEYAISTLIADKYEYIIYLNGRQ